MDKFRLDGKSALVTGGSTGIGFAIARALVEAGARVGIMALPDDQLQPALASLRVDCPACEAFGCDLSDVARIEEQYSTVEKRMGRIDILVNNAGINIRGRADEVRLEDWQKVIAVNLTAPFMLSQAWARRRIPNGETGCIIMTTSLLTEAARPTTSPYSASKSGLRQLIRGLAVDWARFGIRVNGIGPGYIATEMNRPLLDDEEFSTWVKGRTPLGRWGEPDDIGPVAVFLASDAARFITGQVVFVDGGWLATF